MRKAYIYGLFSKRVCVYIGQTVSPAKREFGHLRHRKGKFYKRRLEFRIIRETNSANVGRLEKQIGAAYKRRGEAKESCKFGGTPQSLEKLQSLIEAAKWDWNLSDRELAEIHNTTRQTIVNRRNKLGIDCVTRKPRGLMV